MREDWKQVVIKILNQQVKPDFILVFGSYASRTAREESDLDLVYYSTQILTSYERFLLAEDIAEQVKKDVDLIDIRQVDTVFAAQIYYYGEILFCVDENIYVKERMKALSMYVTLNEQRAEVLQSIKERGNIYGE